jgi:hypothetical protein
MAYTHGHSFGEHHILLKRSLKYVQDAHISWPAWYNISFMGFMMKTPHDLIVLKKRLLVATAYLSPCRSSSLLQSLGRWKTNLLKVIRWIKYTDAPTKN